MGRQRKHAYKIAMLGHKRVPSREGGVEVAVQELSVRLAAEGHFVTCYNRRGHHVCGREFDTAEVKSYKGVQIRSVFTIKGKGFAAMSASVVAALRAAFGPYDVVHFHAEGPCAMIWLPKLLGKRCVTTIHGLDHLRIGKWGGFARRYILFGEKMAVRYADEIIVLSKNMQEYFRNTYGRRTVFIPNGVNRPQKRVLHEAKNRFGLQEEEYILFLGRLVPEKGLGCLIKAFKKVKTAKKLVIAGGASDTDMFAEKLREWAQGDERIMFTGFVQEEMLDELYSNAYVYVLPSDLEGMPLSLLEAMSYGNCCLVSDISECTEVVEDKAIVFQKGDMADLRKKLQWLCDSPEVVTSYRKQATDFVCRKYDWDDVVKRTLEVYRGKVDFE